MMRQCGDDLREKGLERRVVVCFAPDVPRESRAALRASVLAMRAVLATSPADDGVTHILHAPIPSAAAPSAASPEDAPGSTGSQRPTIGAADKPKALGVVGKEALVRLRRHPSSYDHWVALSGIAREAYAEGSVFDAEPPEVDEADDHLGLRARADRASSGPTRVTTEWLTDSEAFNEWCDEREYAWEDPAEKAARVLREATEARERVDARAQEAAASEGLLPGSRKRPREGARPARGGRRRARAFGTAAPLATTAAEETVAPARLAERLAPNLVKRQMVAPHRAVFVAAAGGAGGGGPTPRRRRSPGRDSPGTRTSPWKTSREGRDPTRRGNGATSTRSSPTPRSAFPRRRRKVRRKVRSKIPTTPRGTMIVRRRRPGTPRGSLAAPRRTRWSASASRSFSPKKARKNSGTPGTPGTRTSSRATRCSRWPAAASRARLRLPEAARAREKLATDALRDRVRFSSASTLQQVFDTERWGLREPPEGAREPPWSVAGLGRGVGARGGGARVRGGARDGRGRSPRAPRGTRTNGLGSVGSNPESVPPEAPGSGGRRRAGGVAAREAAEAERGGWRRRAGRRRTEGGAPGGSRAATDWNPARGTPRTSSSRPRREDPAGRSSRPRRSRAFARAGRSPRGAPRRGCAGCVFSTGSFRTARRARASRGSGGSPNKP